MQYTSGEEEEGKKGVKHITGLLAQKNDNGQVYVGLRERVNWVHHVLRPRCVFSP